MYEGQLDVILQVRFGAYNLGAIVGFDIQVRCGITVFSHFEL